MPTLVTETLPALFSSIPVMVKVAIVLVRVISPLDVLLALKLETALAPSNTVPVSEDVVKSAPLTAPLPESEISVEAVKLTLPLPAATAPVKLMAPVLSMETLPPDCVTPVTVKVLAVLIKLISPLVVFVALKLVTVFASVKVVPPSDEVVNSAPSMIALAAWVIVPPLVKVTLSFVVLIPFTVPMSSVKLLTTKLVLLAKVILPSTSAAILANTLLVLSSVAPDE